MEKNQFESVLAEMLATYNKKNADYGNSFSETILHITDCCNVKQQPTDYRSTTASSQPITC